MMRLVALAPALIFGLSPVFAQTYPARPVRIVVPYPPGGATDVVARIIQDRLSALLGQPTFVDNRAGATGAIGSEFVSRSAPDGYTIMYTPGNDMVLRHFLLKANPVDAAKDFSPIVATMKATNLIAAHPSAPFNTAREFVDYAKRNPGKLSYSTPGVGSHFHLSGELLKLHGVELVHVPFKGGGPAVQAALANQVPLTFGNLASMYSLLREGRLKSVALIEKKPLPKDATATLADTLPGYEMPDSWFAFFGPPRLPAPIVNRLNRDIAQVIASPELRAKMDELKMVSITGTPEEVTGYVRFGLEAYGRIVKASAIQPE